MPSVAICAPKLVLISSISAFQKLQNDLPPTLSDSQVTSVQKQLKLTLLGLIKHPAAVEHATTIAKQLTQLGAKTQDIAKVMPKPEEIRRVKKRQQVIVLRKVSLRKLV